MGDLLHRRRAIRWIDIQSSGNPNAVACSLVVRESVAVALGSDGRAPCIDSSLEPQAVLRNAVGGDSILAGRNSPTSTPHPDRTMAAARDSRRDPAAAGGRARGANHL